MFSAKREPGKAVFAFCQLRHSFKYKSFSPEYKEGKLSSIGGECMYLKQKGGRCGLYSYYNLAHELKLPTRSGIREILQKKVLTIGDYKIYPANGMYPEQLAILMSDSLPEGYLPHLVSNDWSIFPPNCGNPRIIRKHLERALRHRRSFKETHSKRQAAGYLALMERWKWKITTEQITLDLLNEKTAEAPVIASCLPMLLYPKIKNGYNLLRGSSALKWDPDKEDSHFFVVARSSHERFRIIDSSLSCGVTRCTYDAPKKDVHASIAMDDQPTLIQLVESPL